MAGTGTLAVAASAAGDGAIPAGEALTEALSALDTSGLKAAKGAKTIIGYEVRDAATGDVLSAKNQATPLTPASNTKLLTSLAVLNSFDGSERFTTTVVSPAEGSIVLVGGGDPTLLSEPAPDDTYPSPANTRDLARATAKALIRAGQRSVTLGYDASYFAEPGWNDAWPATYRDQVTPISALWVDEGRTSGARSTTPAAAAAKIFAAQLRDVGIEVTGDIKAADAEGDVLAKVESIPVHEQVETALSRSNNSFTEVLGLQLAKATGHDTTFAGSVAAIEEQLRTLGVWDDGTVLQDASGLSRGNRITPNMLADGVHLLDTTPRLSVILEGLPVAGVSGTLADRFTLGVSRQARGIARAKTGTLTQVSTMSGTTITKDGRLVSFSFMVNGAANLWAAKVWADQAVGVVTGCGC